MTSLQFDREQRRVLGLALVPLFMSLLSVSIVNVVVPSLEQAMGASPSQLQWVLTGYALAFGVPLVAAGRAGDVFGRARLFLLGVGLFLLGSLLAGFAWDMTVLNIARVVMGLGSGVLNPQGIGLLQQYFDGAQRGKAFGLMGGSVGISVAIGPVAGGLFVAGFGEDWGWRVAFLINVPICLVSILLAKPWFPESAWQPVKPSAATASQPAGVAPPDAHTSHRRAARRRVNRHRADLDPIGTLLFALAVLLLMLPFMESRVSPWVWALTPIAFLCLGVWIWWERRYAARGRTPMVDLGLFRAPSFRNGTIIISLFFLGTTSIWALLALYMQQGLGHSALATGLIGLPSAIASAVASPLVGPHVLRVGRPLVIAGLTLVLLGVVTTLWVVWLEAAGDASIWWLLLTLTLLGFGVGCVVTPNTTLSLIDVPVSYAGAAGGVLQTGQRVGTSVGIAAITGIAFAVLAATGDWSRAFEVGLIVVAVTVVLSLVMSVVDHVQSRGPRSPGTVRPVSGDGVD